jgi:hypothetical protein
VLTAPASSSLRGAPQLEGRRLSRTGEATEGATVSGVPPSPLLGAGAPSAAPEGVNTAIQRGLIAWAEPDLGIDYLATRFPVGTLVEICSLNGCLIRRTNDFGPVGRSKIADLAVLDWEHICGLPRSRGTCPGTIEAIGEIALPPTDMEDE